MSSIKAPQVVCEVDARNTKTAPLLIQGATALNSVASGCNNGLIEAEIMPFQRRDAMT